MPRLLFQFVAILAILPNTYLLATDTSAVANEVRSILSNRCFACHGPDAEERQGGFRLDERESYLAEADSGIPPVVPGDADSSELLRRLLTEDESERMPPPSFGAALSASEKDLIRQWIDQNAPLPEHWSFVPPERAPLPAVELPADLGLDKTWLEHPVDRFVLAQQLERELHPSPPATRAELLRRLSLDLIGLPPSPAEVADFEADELEHAYERQVDRLLASPAFGEHWARKWLDLARYADSAGYADDPERTIWAYRDWVIQALNANMPIDQFTVEQIAGDLLPHPTQDQLVATAFHRNTLTNNEGGTNDEEFRNVAVVDRVNTTMAVWMGVTMACAQCHTHKYDPFTHAEYFQLFAIFNQSQDADRRDESPLIQLFTPEQLDNQRQWQQRVQELEQTLAVPTAESLAELQPWEQSLSEPSWFALSPTTVSTDGNNQGDLTASPTIRIRPRGEAIDRDNYRLELQVPATSPTTLLTALALRTVPQADLPGAGAGLGGGNFVVTNITGTLLPKEQSAVEAQFVRIELPGSSKILSLAEVQVFVGEQNVAVGKTATQSSTDFGGDATRAIDGNTSGNYAADNSTTHSAISQDPWWELDLGMPHLIERLAIWNRTDNNLQSRLNGAQVTLLDAARQPLFSHTLTEAPESNAELSAVPRIPIRFILADASHQQSGFPAAATIDNDPASGWAVGGQIDQSHRLTLIPANPIELEPGMTLQLDIEHNSPHPQHLLASFQIEASNSATVAGWTRLPPNFRAIHAKSSDQRSTEEQTQWAQYFHRHLAASTAAPRQELEKLQQQLAKLKPASSVPIMRDLAKEEQRKTHIHLRGNYKSLGDEVQPGTPAVFHPVSLRGTTEQQAEQKNTEQQPAHDTEQFPDRLDLAHWLVDRRNPLTARVWVNRLWESLFGIGIVRSSEEFGSQGDKPTHPELLDWLACELMDSGWNNKQMLRLLVTSQAYRQTSKVSRELLAQDQDNIWLARGPRVRLSAEMIRDQSLAAAGILSRKMYGPPVRPPQPNLGLTAAFGSGTDWTTSEGEDRFRRGVYTTWRRSNPYPSMATFDAPSREVCTLRRDSTNTPLQALVTLNDPAFVEAAQALARRVVLQSEPLDEARLRTAFVLCTSRPPLDNEVDALLNLLAEAKRQLSEDPAGAMQLATEPLGPLPEGANAIELAAWTSVCNVLLNLDEVLMKR
jgi:mono/diheme cytochrome c family protein